MKDSETFEKNQLAFSLYLKTQIREKGLFDNLEPFFQYLSIPQGIAGGKEGYQIHLNRIKELWDKGFKAHRNSFTKELKTIVKANDRTFDKKVINNILHDDGINISKIGEFTPENALSTIINKIREYEL